MTTGGPAETQPPGNVGRDWWLRGPSLASAARLGPWLSDTRNGDEFGEGSACREGRDGVRG